jgi:hypothetical protein
MVRGKEFYSEVEAELEYIANGGLKDEEAGGGAADAAVQQSLTLQKGVLQGKITKLELQLKKAQEDMAKLDKQIATKKVSTGIQ